MATATYKKLRDGSWGIRTTTKPAEHAGLHVTKKSGEQKWETVEKILWTDGSVWLCTITQSQSQHRSYRSSSYDDKSNIAPGGRRCDYCGSRSCSRAWNPRDLCDEDWSPWRWARGQRPKHTLEGVGESSELGGNW